MLKFVPMSIDLKYIWFIVVLTKGIFNFAIFCIRHRELRRIVVKMLTRRAGSRSDSDGQPVRVKARQDK
ncbi:unnamed protein product, partial [Mesorhabditis spiculigera]